MIKLEIETSETELKVRLDLPDKPGEMLKLTELALFTLYLDVVKQRVTELTNRAISRGDGYDLTSAHEFVEGQLRNA